MSFADAIELSTHLKKVLADHLGEWVDGTPRIHIAPPRPKLAGRSAQDTANGSELECIITRTPSGEPQNRSGPQKYQDSVYTVELVNYADDTKLTKALSAVDADSRIVFAQPKTYIPASDLVYEQTALFIRTVSIINSVVHTS